VTCIQRFGLAFNLNPHLYVLIPDGVWVIDAQGSPTFRPAPTPTDDDIQQIVERTA
jgi:hypothetical protein